jgi:hypothetical protein
LSDNYESASHFLEKMDSGELDQNLGTELKKLTDEQAAEVCRVLMDRDTKRDLKGSGS